MSSSQLAVQEKALEPEPELETKLRRAQLNPSETAKTLQLVIVTSW